MPSFGPPPMTYYVFYTYSPKYNPDRAISGRLEWSWLTAPQTWEEYEQVRMHIARFHSAKHVMLYAVIPTEEHGKFCGVKNYLYKNGNRKTGTVKPWEGHEAHNGS